MKKNLKMGKKEIIFKYINNTYFLSFILFLIIVTAGAGFTKIGIIPNFLDVEILCIGNEDNNKTPSNLPSNFGRGGLPVLHKPIIYLYPEEKTNVEVNLDYQGEIIADYPEYNYDIKGWDVIAYPNSTIKNKADNKEYSYIFWEGKAKEEIDWDIDKGFVVKGEDSREFLQDILPKIGLTPKEYNEFVVYWYPLMQENPYNLIHFSGKQYTDTAPLETIPEYESLLRVFMVVKPLNVPIGIEPQSFEKFNRSGFTVVEWGGTILK